MLAALSRLLAKSDSTELCPLELRLQRLGIEGVVRDLHKIDREIVTEAFAAVFRSLISSGAKFKGTTFEYGDKRYDILTASSPETRELSIIIQPRFVSRFETVSVKRNIEEFGQMRWLTSTCPFPTNYMVERALVDAETVIRDGYRTVEIFFRRNFRTFGELLFSDLFTLLNRQLERDGKILLVGKAFFTVTAQRTKRFRYFFDGESLDMIIRHFKSHQVGMFSPAELVSVLLSTEAADTLNLLIDVSEGGFDSIETSDYVSQSEDLLFWQAESMLVNHEAVTSFTILKDSRLVFQINCERKYTEQFRESFEKSQAILIRRFQDHLDQYLNHAKALKTIPRPSRSDGAKNVILEQLGSIIGSALASFVKKLAKE